MPHDLTRRRFVHSAVAAGLGAGAALGAFAAMKYPICVTCGMQFGPSEHDPEHCPICEDERQYVGHDGQMWTTLDDYHKTHKNVFHEEEKNLYSIHPQPKAGIGQRAFLVETPAGNLLWDCVPPLDNETVTTVKKLGGLAGIAVSHPHYYTTMVEWSHAFGKVPIHIHQLDSKWVMRPDPVVRIWDGVTLPLFGGLTLINTGGHFDGYQVLHWPAGASGKGVLLAGDQPYVAQDRRWLSFMYSYPNLIPLGASALRRITERLQPFPYDRLYGAFPGQLVPTGAKPAVERSAHRYLRMIAT